MKKPPPEIGMVIQFDFLWSYERDKGFQDGAKDRPCVVITAVDLSADGKIEVLVAPITHSEPDKTRLPIEMPKAVAKNLGLDDERMFVITDEANSLDWDDPGFIPAFPGKSWIYGRVPMALYSRIKSNMLSFLNAKSLNLSKRS